MARKAPAGSGTVARRGLDWTAGLAILATAMAVAALPLCAVLAAGLLPTAVAAMVDRHPRRYLVRAVGPLNLAGTVLPVLALFKSEFSLTGALHVLTDPHNWLVMYGAAGIGSILHWVTPQIVQVVLDFLANRAEQQLRRRAEQIIAEWGTEVGGTGPVQPPK